MTGKIRRQPLLLSQSERDRYQNSKTLELRAAKLYLSGKVKLSNADNFASTGYIIRNSVQEQPNSYYMAA